MKAGYQPASPISEEQTDRIDAGVKIYTGLSKREHFAGLALQGILANYKYDAPRRNKLSLMAVDAVSAADSLILTLEDLEDQCKEDWLAKNEER